ncbi:MAG: tail fiber domain-containing protein [Candidatus Udaeobacter sp.]
MKPTTSTISNLVNDSLLRRALMFIPFVLMCFTCLLVAQAVSPAPVGGYPNGNTAEGQNALLRLSTGTFNTAIGVFSLESLTEGNFNTGVGAGALLANTAIQNTATGAGALLNNTTGFSNTANGAFALFSNTTANVNTAVGMQALFNNTEGGGNTAIGDQALVSNTIGGLNTAVGHGSFDHNTTGNQNTAVGFVALGNSTTGSRNIALGDSAGDLVVDANDVICIGARGENVSNSCYIAQIDGTTIADGTPVFVNGFNKLGTMTSSRQFKNDINTMEKASEAILALRPVTFHYKGDANRTPQFGLIAEEVAQVNPALVLPDKEGKPYTVRYEAVNAMLLNEFLKEHCTVQRLKSTVAKQEAAILYQKKDFQAIASQQQKQIEALTAGLQKVSAQLAAASPSRGGLEASKFATGRIRRGGPAPQVVNNP